MEDPFKRIKHLGLRKYVCSVEEAAGRIKDGNLVATSGNTLAGYPKAFFMGLAERIRGGEKNKNRSSLLRPSGAGNRRGPGGSQGHPEKDRQHRVEIIEGRGQQKGSGIPGRQDREGRPICQSGVLRRHRRGRNRSRGNQRGRGNHPRDQRV